MWWSYKYKCPYVKVKWPVMTCSTSPGHRHTSTLQRVKALWVTVISHESENKSSKQNVFFKKLYELEEHYHFLLLQLSKERTDQMNLVLLIIFVFVTCFGKLCFRKSMLSSGISESIYIWPKSNLKCLLGTHCQGVVTLEVRQCRCTWSR